MRIHELSSTETRRTKRRGRGNASGRGTYSGRGIKGQKARAGARIRTGFEGGQTPLFQRLPKRRGSGKTAPRPFPINVDLLERLFPAGTTIDMAALRRADIIRPTVRAAKVLGTGNLSKSFTVRIPASKEAIKKIEAAGGRVELPEVR